MARAYSMRGVQGAADRGVELARASLLALSPQSRIHDVQVDPRFQHRGVDLLWELPDGDVKGVEVKADRQGRRRNYFFELVSNLEKDTPGCFLYSTADVLVYTFLVEGEIHHLPLIATREWFLPRAKQYALRHTQTRTGPLLYTTVGAIVPIKDVLAGVAGATRYRLEDGSVQDLG
ncbi:MAG: hypothetical protein ACT4TC_06335 [Myxococcaceae bacterium]